MQTRPILDTLVAAETPEGMTLELRPAGLAARFYAFLLDLLIRIAVLYAVAIVTTFMGGVGLALWLILLFALEWLYPVVFELSRSGATPGKRALRIKVIMDNGLPITPAASLTRNLLRVADFLPIAYGFGVASILLRRDFKRLGDIAAATLVVYEPRATTRAAIADIAPLAPARPITLRDQAAVIALAARAPRLTAERVEELAALAGPVIGNAPVTGPEATRRMLAVARWLLGHR
jgi:uncharacterized RDD family membrane protein YckC